VTNEAAAVSEIIEAKKAYVDYAMNECLKHIKNSRAFLINAEESDS